MLRSLNILSTHAISQNGTNPEDSYITGGLRSGSSEGMLMMMSSAAESSHHENLNMDGSEKGADVTCSPDDDIFSNLPEIENLSTCGGPNKTKGGTVDIICWSFEEDMFTSFPDAGNLSFQVPWEMEVEVIETGSTDEDIFENLPEIEDLNF